MNIKYKKVKLIYIITTKIFVLIKKCKKTIEPEKNSNNQEHYDML